MKLLILRHAHSSGNELKLIDSSSHKLDFGLSAKGKRQSEELIPLLGKYKIDTFIVSPLKRSLETLKPYLGTMPNPKVLVNELTLERDAGEFTGKGLDAIREYCEKNKITDRVSFKPKGGESILEVHERAKKFLSFLKGRFKDESILICGHKNFLTCLEILLKNKDIHDFYSIRELGNGEIREFLL